MKFYHLKSLNYIRRNLTKSSRGYSLSELLVASAISLIALTSAYSLVGIMLERNKSEEKSLQLHNKTDFALDFMIDEINSSKRVIIDPNDLPAKCKEKERSFLFGLILPEQAYDYSAYTTAGLENKDKLWKKIECPIIYKLIKDNKTAEQSYKIIRKGVLVNDECYYLPLKITTSLILDGISKDLNYESEKTNCSSGWITKRRHGVTICADRLGRGAEIAISINEPFMQNRKTELLKTSAGYSRIQDEALVSHNPGNDSSNGQPCKDPSCNIGGVPIVSRLLTFHLDVSGSMGTIVYPIGQSRMTLAKLELINAINSLKTCKKSHPNCVKLQVVLFSTRSTNLFGGPIELTETNRSMAILKIKKIKPGGSTKPWIGLMNSVKNQDVSQIIVIGDGGTQDDIGYCEYTNTSIPWLDCIRIYNAQFRSTTKTGTVKIDAISIGNNFCMHNGWMGKLTSQNDGTCVVR